MSAENCITCKHWSEHSPGKPLVGVCSKILIKDYSIEFGEPEDHEKIETRAYFGCGGHEAREVEE